MYLDLLNKTLFPKWPEIFASAEKVMERLKAGDSELHDHLKTVAQIDANFNPKVAFWLSSLATVGLCQAGGSCLLLCCVCSVFVASLWQMGTRFFHIYKLGQLERSHFATMTLFGGVRSSWCS